MNYYYCENKKNIENENLLLKDPTYRKQTTRPTISYLALPTIRTDLITYTEDDETNEQQFQRLERKIQETMITISPTNKNRKTVAILKPNFLKVSNKVKNRSALLNMDDIEIIDKLSNFTGVLNLWYCLSINERFKIWSSEAKEGSCFMEPYQKTIIWNTLNFKSENFKKTGLEENNILRRIIGF